MERLSPLSRRRVIVSGLGFAALGVGGPAWAQTLIATPPQTAGPFYPSIKPVDSDADLLRVRGRTDRAQGEVLYIEGRVLDRDARPVAAHVEIWQADALGQYHTTAEAPAGGDPGFQGFGRAAAGADGRYRFRTIKPVPYSSRTPHVHFKIAAPGFAALTTQMYVAGHPMNARDFVLRRIRGARARARVIVPLVADEAAEPGALTARFDIVLEGA